MSLNNKPHHQHLNKLPAQPLMCTYHSFYLLHPSSAFASRPINTYTHTPMSWWRITQLGLSRQFAGWVSGCLCLSATYCLLVKVARRVADLLEHTFEIEWFGANPCLDRCTASCHVLHKAICLADVVCHTNWQVGCSQQRVACLSLLVPVWSPPSHQQHASNCIVVKKGESYFYTCWLICRE